MLSSELYVAAPLFLFFAANIHLTAAARPPTTTSFTIHISGPGSVWTDIPAHRLASAVFEVCAAGTVYWPAIGRTSVRAVVDPATKRQSQSGARSGRTADNTVAVCVLAAQQGLLPGLSARLASRPPVENLVSQHPIIPSL